MGSQYKFAMKFSLRSKKFWDFIKNSHLAAISSHCFTGASYFAIQHTTDEAESDGEDYCILDRHNFDSIDLVDVEAG